MTSYDNEEGYLQLLRDTLLYGEKKNTRNGMVYSQFATMLSFSNVSQFFPLLTTKRMFIKGIVEELLWFLRGSTNCRELQDKGVHIWDNNSTREYLDSVGLPYDEGELGPIYGWQWRSFGRPYPMNGVPEGPEAPKGIDQLKYVLTELMKENSRRAVISSWNPTQLHEMALPPCHVMYTFYKDSHGLSCLMNMRSSDLFLGLPFNIASTALLTCIIARVLHMTANKVTIVSADAHIYEEHVEAVKKQFENDILEKPMLCIDWPAPHIESSIEEKIAWIETLCGNDFLFTGYTCSGPIKAVMK